MVCSPAAGRAVLRVDGPGACPSDLTTGSEAVPSASIRAVGDGRCRPVAVAVILAPSQVTPRLRTSKPGFRWRNRWAAARRWYWRTRRCSSCPTKRPAPLPTPWHGGVVGYAGSATAARMPMIATTIISSMRVKPCWTRFMGELSLEGVGARDTLECRGRARLRKRPRIPSAVRDMLRIGDAIRQFPRRRLVRDYAQGDQIRRLVCCPSRRARFDPLLQVHRAHMVAQHDTIIGHQPGTCQRHHSSPPARRGAASDHQAGQRQAKT